MDAELQEVFNFAVENGVNIFDTADSYGTGRLNGRSELLLGKFIQEFPGFLSQSAFAFSFTSLKDDLLGEGGTWEKFSQYGIFYAF
jgi:diketogulonate reductase-like aldo/keto reductase